MTSPAQSCMRDDSLADVAREMWDYEICAMPVVDAERRPIGSVTDRSICMAALRTRKRLDLLRAGDALLTDVPVVHEDVPLEQAERLLRAADGRWLPVVGDDGTLIGVVTSGDVVRALRAVGRRALSGKRSLAAGGSRQCYAEYGESPRATHAAPGSRRAARRL